MNSYIFKSAACIFFILIAGSSFSQSVSGILKDAKTQETIPYATVSIGNNYGVITNDEGAFMISTARFTANDSLTFSSLGYEKVQIAIKDFEPGTVYLSENVNKLDNVYISNQKVDVKEVLKKVNERIPENYDNSLQEFTIFQRIKETSKIADYNISLKKASFVDRKNRDKFNISLDSISQETLNSSSTQYDDYLMKVQIGENGVLKKQYQKGTILLNRDKQFSMDDLSSNIASTLGKNLESPYTFKFSTGIIPIISDMDFNEKEKEKRVFPMYSFYKPLRMLEENGFAEGSIFDFVLRPNAYEYQLLNITDFNGEVVYVINFKPDRRSAKYEGQLLISAETFAVVKADYKLAEGKKTSNVNLKFILGAHYMEDQRSGAVIYEKNGNNRYVPKYIKIQGRDNIYMDRPFALRENNPNRKERIKIKFDLLVNMLESYEVELLFVETKNMTSSEFQNFENKMNISPEVIEKYDPQIWKDYNIIAPNQAIMEFEF